MAWRSHGYSNDSLVDSLAAHGLIKTAPVERAMRAVDRGGYSESPGVYCDIPQSIGCNATISAPHMHAMMLELLAAFLNPGARVLDVGSGSGILTAYMAHMVGPGGRVFGVEHIDKLVERARGNVLRANPSFVEQGLVEFVAGDGRDGLPREAPFDAIHVGAAAPTVPQTLVDQLAPGGRMVIPVGGPGQRQRLATIDKLPTGDIVRRNFVDVAFVPLCEKDYQLERHH